MYSGVDIALPAAPVHQVPETVAAELSVVVPTLNERANIPILVGKLAAALEGISWEVVFVDDDSRDGTADVIRELARSDTRVRCVQRIGRRGLSSACIEGILSSSAPVVAVMDADLQHDECLLPMMYADMLASCGQPGSEIEVAVASRYVPGGSVGEWESGRVRISGLATRLSRLIVRSDLADPMSGFFMIRRDTFMEAVRTLSGQGFKILLDIFASVPRPLRFREYPFTFRARQHGESKLDSMVAWEYLMLIADKLIGEIIPVRFIMFAMIGCAGVAVNLAVLCAGLWAGATFGFAEAVATVAAMTSNFALNNHLTYRDRRLKGVKLAKGLLKFCLACGIGAVANVGIAATMFRSNGTWWLAGLAGALIGAVWNYAIASAFTWGRR